jgi:outer membrane usher protein
MFVFSALGAKGESGRRTALLTLLLALPLAHAEQGKDNASPGEYSPAAALNASGADAGEARFEELLLEARVNGLPPAQTLLALRDGEGRLWLSADSFSAWRMHPPTTPAISHLGRDFHMLDGQAGLSYLVDRSRLALEVEATPAWFTGNRVDSGFRGGRSAPSVNPGGFFNYDLNLAHSDSDTYSAGLFEAGAFGAWGVGTSTFLARSGQAGPGGGLLRLDSTWTRDLPERRASLRVGDAVGGASAWGRPVRFGGVQWASNFATQPGFISFPLPTLQGEAALPSTLELYVNGMRRMSSEVPTGPFSIPDLPVVTGQGEVQLVVRDLLGREQLITDSFYVSARLLQQGLHEFSYELGAERENYGTESNNYGRAFAVGTHRLGLSDRFTGEARAEALAGQYTAGLGGALLLGNYGVIHGSLAASHSDRGQGGQLTLGFERSSRRVGFGFNLQMAEAGFTQLGLREDQPAPRRIGQAWVSLPLRQAGSVSLGYVHRDERDRERFESLTARYQVSLGALGHLGVFATRIGGEQDDTVFGLNFTRSLGNRTTSSASANRSDEAEQLLLQWQRSLPVGTGLGYRMRAGLLDQDRLDAGFSAQNDYGTWHLDVSHADSQTGVRASASGGVALLDGGLHLSRRIDDSFAVVKVADFEGVRIYADNQHVATTGEDGRALLPRLRAYQENPLRIEVADLPMDARVEQLEQQAVPYFHSGVVVDFAVSRSRNATFRLLRAGGEPVPAGSIITAPDGERFPVGFDGVSFVTGLDSGIALSAQWNGTRCAFELVLPETEEPMPDLGILNCVEEHR